MRNLLIIFSSLWGFLAEAQTVTYSVHHNTIDTLFVITNNGLDSFPMTGTNNPVVWGGIYGRIAQQPDLQLALSAKEPAITTLSFAKGGIGGAQALTSAAVMAVTMNTEIVTLTPTIAGAINATGGVTGQRVTFIITTSGITSFIQTFGTNFKAAGTLATGTVTAKKFTVSFIYDGTTWIETSRTIAM